MYTATCPQCATLIPASSGPGPVWVVCPICQHGALLVSIWTPQTPTPRKSAMLTPMTPLTKQPLQPSPLPPSSAAMILQTFQQLAGGDPTEQTPGEARDELREWVYALAPLITEGLRAVSEADWRLGLEAAYGRVQVAHEGLYCALGDKHMGEYKPGKVAVERAVVTLCVWVMVAMRAAERTRDGA